MPIWQARSFYAAGLLVAVVIANFLGFDLMGFFESIGLGSSDYEVVANLQVLAPLALGVWAWLERRAPKFKLVWKLF